MPHGRVASGKRRQTRKDDTMQSNRQGLNMFQDKVRLRTAVMKVIIVCAIGTKVKEVPRSDTRPVPR